MNYVGTSGFTYKNWTGAFYPKEVAQKRWLEYYCEHFNSVEINNSFYRLPQAKIFAGWHDRTPHEFQFAIKGSRYVTHITRLKDPAPHIKKLTDRAAALGDKLGVILWQLPSNFKFDTRLETFAGNLGKDKLKTRHAIEVRHDSWFCEEAYSPLRRHNIALVIAHSDKWPYRDDVKTADFLYVRFHGAPVLYTSDYDDAALRGWSDKLRRLADGDDIYAYFNNDANVHAPDNARALAAFLR